MEPPRTSTAIQESVDLKVSNKELSEGWEGVRSGNVSPQLAGNASPGPAGNVSPQLAGNASPGPAGNASSDVSGNASAEVSGNTGNSLSVGNAGSSAPSDVRVAVIDDFTAEPGGGFNHGESIRSIIENGGAINNGAVSGGAPAIDTLNYHIDTGNGDRTQWVANSLNDVYNRLAGGEDIDAVNLSQQDFNTSNATEQVRQTVQRIQNDFGVPVVVAAGNQGAQGRNVLADGALFRVENSEDGSETRAGNSGAGNIRSEGAFTSQATANVTARAAQLKNQGYSLDQIQFMVQVEAYFEGGSLDAAPNNPVSTPGRQLAPDVLFPDVGFV